MNVDLRSKTYCMFGLRGSGKSTLANYIANEFGSRALVYDTLHESPDSARYDVYKPKVRNSTAELDQIISRLPQSGYKLFVIDEANRYAPSKPSPLPPMLADLNDQCRHYGISVCYIARRPVQLNQDLTELSDYLFIFHLKGKGDIKYLNDLSDGLGDAVLALKGYQYILVLPDRSFRLQHAVSVSEKWLKSAERHLQQNR
jgi:hypothetical protein